MKNIHHIMIVSNTSWYLYNFRRKLIRLLLERGYRVTAVAPHDDYSGRIEKIGADFIDIPIDNNGKNPIKDMKTVLYFYRLYREIEPEVILHYTPKPNIYGTFAARLAGIKAVNNIAGLGNTFIHSGWTNTVVRILYRHSQRYAAKVFFQNPEDMRLFDDEKLVSMDLADLLPGSGVDTQRFAPREKEETDAFSCILIARLLWEKGIREYLEAAKILKNEGHQIDFQLLGFADDGNPRAVPKKEVRQWEEDGYIRWLGSTDDVRPFIAQADCIVLPSYREGTPRSLLEASSMGKPVITTDVVGCRQVVQDGVNGFLCRVKDPDDLAEKIKKMAELNESERALLGNNGRKKIVSEFDESIVINKYLEVIESIVRIDRTGCAA